MDYDYESIKKLAKELGRPVETLLALAPANDPFYAGAPARQEQAEWFADLRDRFEFRHGVHLRRIHYVLVSQTSPIPLWDGTPYENTERCWEGMIKASKSARDLRLVSPSAFIDQRSEAPLIALVGECNTTISVEDFGTLGLRYLPELPALPKLKLSGAVILQRYLIEIWVEKSTLSEILIPLHHRYDVNIQTGVGELSETRCQQFVERAKRDGRPARLLYVSDFDPGGQSMPVAVARKIEHCLYEDDLDLDIQVRPVMLTHDQCIEYCLPRTPIKESEKRAAHFEARFGEGATELDALEALHPGEISRILTDEIERYYDHDLDERVEEAERELKEEIGEITNDVHREHEQEIAEIRAAYDDLRRRFVSEIRPLGERYNSVWHAITESLEANAPDPDDYEWPEPEDGDEDPDPLFDSSRDYLTQMARYKEFQGKPAGRVLQQMTCTVCERPFEAIRKSAKYCSGKCRDTFKRNGHLRPEEVAP